MCNVTFFMFLGRSLAVGCGGRAALLLQPAGGSGERSHPRALLHPRARLHPRASCPRDPHPHAPHPLAVPGRPGQTRDPVLRRQEEAVSDGILMFNLTPGGHFCSLFEPRRRRTGPYGPTVRTTGLNWIKHLTGSVGWQSSGLDVRGRRLWTYQSPGLLLGVSRPSCWGSPGRALLLVVSRALLLGVSRPSCWGSPGPSCWGSPGRALLLEVSRALLLGVSRSQ